MSKVLPNYTKVDTNGREVVYWTAKGACDHITIYEVQCFEGDVIFCRRCDGATEVVVVKHMRPQVFIEQFGGKLNT